MPKRKSFVGTGIALSSLAFLLVIHGCGSSSSTFNNTDSDGGTVNGGDDSSFTTGGDDGGGGNNAASGAPTTCVVGTQGCLCDSTGGCAPNLTCTPQPSPRPNLCCNGTDCSSVGGTIGKSCAPVSGAPTCTPGVTIPAATGGNDGCGYPATSFIESSTLCAITASGGGAKPAIIQLFYNDEHALTLGCGTASHPVSAMTANPDAVKYPQTGDPACVDTVGRAMRPVLYVTDLSGDPTCTAGDQQKGGTAYDPIAVFGTWKGANEGANNIGTPITTEPKNNTWNLGPSADPVPASATAACNQGFGAELRYEVGLISGHSYRLQVIAHDGDQTKGGDSGEACAVFCAGTGTLCGPGVAQCGAPTDPACPAGTACVQGCCLSQVK